MQENAGISRIDCREPWTPLPVSAGRERACGGSNGLVRRAFLSEGGRGTKSGADADQELLVPHRGEETYLSWIRKFYRYMRTHSDAAEDLTVRPEDVRDYMAHLASTSSIG